jgi:hypothetical protein
METSSFLPAMKTSKTSKLKSGSYLDDDSLEILHKHPQLNSKHGDASEKVAQSSKLQKPRDKKTTGKHNRTKVPVHIPTTIEKMYDSLRNANKDNKDQSSGFPYEGTEVSINVGRNVPESMDAYSEQHNLHAFDIATGSINHGNRFAIASEL